MVLATINVQIKEKDMNSISKDAIAFLKAVDRWDFDQYMSFDRQYKKIEKYANKNNMKICMVFDNFGPSGFVAKELDEMLSYCSTNPNIKYLLVDSYERITRRPEDFCDWQNKFNAIGVTIKSTSQNYTIVRPLEWGESSKFQSGLRGECLVV
jgi:DNA invertase Pin-like site-specific DNA recombinase